MKSRKSDKNRKREKRGQGTLKDYKPWILVHEISSNGVSWRILGRKTGRIHHLLSTLEKKVFLFMDNHPKVIDIREQFPLPLDQTLRIAQAQNLKHGSNDGEFKVMTTDFLIDLPGKQLAISVKPFKGLNKRVVEKLQIEKMYWESKNVQMFFWTDREINNLTIEQ